MAASSLRFRKSGLYWERNFSSEGVNHIVIAGPPTATTIPLKAFMSAKFSWHNAGESHAPYDHLPHSPDLEAVGRGGILPDEALQRLSFEKRGFKICARVKTEPCVSDYRPQ